MRLGKKFLHIPLSHCICMAVNIPDHSHFLEVCPYFTQDHYGLTLDFTSGTWAKIKCEFTGNEIIGHLWCIKNINKFVPWLSLCNVSTIDFPTNDFKWLTKEYIFQWIYKLELEIENEQEEEQDIYCYWVLRILATQTKNGTRTGHADLYYKWGSPAEEARVFSWQKFLKEAF